MIFNQEKIELVEIEQDMTHMINVAIMNKQDCIPEAVTWPGLLAYCDEVAIVL